ncbi:hypothetical protein FHS31_001468 [Sphingomonas vulcanisoli]|uniref:Uncharacterized protein n=1 Tax=Sphingomonas vulcanisoli TaxID=1658060 RepID=A0ABX0TQQ6_9SPHN|nr:hypothetical protein [Sphingomonas vulcanisoli]NIJ07858.1 hypothetical protein [Sphingomonas vulcanisoli]
MRSEDAKIRLEDLPELPDAVGMAGGLDDAGGGQPCAETGVLLALLVYGGG